MKSKTMFIIAILLLMGTMIISGCSSQSSTGNYAYRTQDTGASAPVGGGCGVASAVSDAGAALNVAAASGSSL